jgi:hypothetical protein
MCVYVDHPHVVAGWMCCRCAIYNGLQRASCKNCGEIRHTPLEPDLDTGARHETYEEAYANDPEMLAKVNAQLAAARARGE